MVNEMQLFAQKEKCVSPVAYIEDPDSPLHGLSLDQLEDVSVMPVSGWSNPKPMSVFTDGGRRIFSNQRVACPSDASYFMDETLWSHRPPHISFHQHEVILIELDTY